MSRSVDFAAAASFLIAMVCFVFAAVAQSMAFVVTGVGVLAVAAMYACVVMLVQVAKEMIEERKR